MGRRQQVLVFVSNKGLREGTMYLSRLWVGGSSLPWQSSKQLFSLSSVIVKTTSSQVWRVRIWMTCGVRPTTVPSVYTATRSQSNQVHTSNNPYICVQEKLAKRVDAGVTVVKTIRPAAWPRGVWCTSFFPSLFLHHVTQGTCSLENEFDRELSSFPDLYEKLKPSLYTCKK